MFPGSYRLFGCYHLTDNIVFKIITGKHSCCTCCHNAVNMMMDRLSKVHCIMKFNARIKSFPAYEYWSGNLCLL